MKKILQILGGKMNEITEDVSEQLNEIGGDLDNLESLSRIMQVCLKDEDNLKNWDVETIFEVLKSKITETKKDFNDIAKTLGI